MKILQEIYGLFVDDPWLALFGLVALAAGAVVVKLGLGAWAGLPVVVVIIVGLVMSVRRG
jgi:hypothetical protein